MHFALFIAKRYLFSKKSHNAINIISAISACGVALATLALVCTLSVFNGFHDLVAQLFTSFDPELKVTLVEGKTFSSADSVVKALRNSDYVEVVTPVLEDNALVVKDGKQTVVTIKGVDDNFQQQTNIDEILYPETNSEIVLHADVLEYGLLGIQLAAQLGLNADFHDPLPIYAPKKGERVNMANPMASFNRDELQSPGVVFMVRQNKYDANYILTSLGFAQRLFDQRGRVTQLEVKLRKGVSAKRGKQEVVSIVGERFRVQDRFEQQEDIFRIMRIEKLIAYLFLSFILLVACFNIIGSLSMLMIDKSKDIDTLRSLGADDKLVRSIFVWEGRMICLLGAVLGIALGVFVCWLQQTFGLLTMGDNEGAFIIEAYPVSVRLTDIILVFFTVIFVSWTVVAYPVRKLKR